MSVSVQEKKYSDSARWTRIYPAYLNGKKTIAEGRRVGKENSVENPTCEEIREVLNASGFQVAIENKLYPREQNKDNFHFRGCVVVQLKNDDGTPVKAELPTKKIVLMYLGKMIPHLKTRAQGKGTSDSSQNAQNAGKKKSNPGKRKKK